MNIRGRPSDNDQPLAITSGGRGAAIDPGAGSPRFHDLNLAGAHVPNLVDFASAFPNNTTDEIVGDEDLLRLELVLLLRRVVLGRRGRVIHVEIRITGNI